MARRDRDSGRGERGRRGGRSGGGGRSERGGRGGRRGSRGKDDGRGRSRHAGRDRGARGDRRGGRDREDLDDDFDDEDDYYEPPKADNKALIIGGAVGAVIIVIALVMFSGGKSEPIQKRRPRVKRTSIQDSYVITEKSYYNKYYNQGQRRGHEWYTESGGKFSSIADADLEGIIDRYRITEKESVPENYKKAYQHGFRVGARKEKPPDY